VTRAPHVELRSATEADRDFLARVYASTRADELAALPWPAEQRQAFLAQQFHAQSVHYAAHFADASFDVIVVDGERAGRIVVARRAGEMTLVDVALLPEHRGHGVGSGLIASLLDEADELGATVVLHVERFNRARALYERLGFEVVADTGAHLRMRRRPATRRGLSAR
jgi:ribosomal protein S18 acetylase RimI-like enzyme